MNKWSIYYVGQRKDKLYAWKVSLSCVIHTNQHVGKDKIFFFFLIFLSSQQLNQSYKICIEDSPGGKNWSHHENLTFTAWKKKKTH